MRPSTFVLPLCVITGYLISVGSPMFPPFLETCHLNDPHLNECVKHSVEALRPHLKTGIPDLHIPPCEPLHVPHIEIAQASGPVSIKSTYSNIKVQGGTDFVLKNVKIDIDKDCIRMELYLPKLQMISDYDMNGKIMMIPIIGNGKARGNFTDINAHVKIDGQRYQDERTSKIHYGVTNFHVDFDVGTASMHLENLFNGDETMSEAMHLFLNANWKTVVTEIKPVLENTISKLFTALSNKIYSKYPIDMLLPP